MKTYQTDFAKVFFGDKEHPLEKCTDILQKPIVFGHQVHKADLIKLNSKPGSSNCLVESSDGLFTTQKNFPLGLYTADCIPCILATKNQLFSLHLGWKGLYSGLLKKALQKIQRKEELDVFIGPHIHFSSFEVQIDLIDKFSRIYPDSSKWSKLDSGKYYISLLNLIKMDLKSSKISYNLYHDAQDTFKSNDHYSYRADNKTLGRNLSFSFLSS